MGMAQTLLKRVLAEGLTDKIRDEVMSFLTEQESPEAKGFRAAAQAETVDGELEVDDNAVVSLCVEDGEATGAYVEAWVWVEGLGL